MSEEARLLGKLVASQEHFGSTIERIERKQDEIHTLVSRSREEAAAMKQEQDDHKETDDRRFESHGKRIANLENGGPTKKQLAGATTGLVGLGAAIQWFVNRFGGHG